MYILQCVLLNLKLHHPSAKRSNITITREKMASVLIDYTPVSSPLVTTPHPSCHGGATPRVMEVGGVRERAMISELNKAVHLKRLECPECGQSIQPRGQQHGGRGTRVMPWEGMGTYITDQTRGHFESNASTCTCALPLVGLAPSSTDNATQGGLF